MSKTLFFITLSLFALFSLSCREEKESSTGNDAVEFTAYEDTSFWQEFHEGYPVSKGNESNFIRSIAVDNKGVVWIATPSGAFSKEKNDHEWSDAIPSKDQGPSFSVILDKDSSIWIST